MDLGIVDSSVMFKLKPSLMKMRIPWKSNANENALEKYASPKRDPNVELTRCIAFCWMFGAKVRRFIKC
jgi:hypothetical protein